MFLLLLLQTNWWEVVMIDDALIVKDTRKVRHAISKKFNNDIDKYIDYVVTKREKHEDQKVLSVKERKTKYSG